MRLLTAGRGILHTAQQQDAQRQHQQDHQQHQHEGDKGCFRPVARGARGFTVQARQQRQVAQALHLLVEDGQQQGDTQLHSRQRRCQGQVQQVQCLQVYFHLEGGEARAAQHEDHGKGGEIEQEHQHSRRQQGGSQQGQGHFTQGAPWRSAQHPRGMHGFEIELRPGRPHHADDDGKVVKDVHQQNRPQGVRE